MTENSGNSEDGIRQAASESIWHGEDVRERVRELTLNALTSRRFDREAIRETVRAVTEGMSLGAEGAQGAGTAGTRDSLAEAFRGMDQALAKSVEAGQEAIRRILDTGRGLSEHELQQALAGLQKIEEDFVATVTQVAETAGERVAPELRDVVGKATHAGTETGRQAAAAATELTRTLAGASLKVTLAGIEVAGEVGVRIAQIAGGVLAGMASALDKPPPETKKPF